MIDMDIMNSTKLDFEKLEYIRPTEEFNGLIIVPTNELHDSGYGCMKFVLLNHHKVVGCVGGGSDVIHLNGIGGYGKYVDYEKVIKTDMVKRVDWSIDCLPCGLLRLFCSSNLSIDDFIYSDFCLYVNKDDKNDEL